MEAQHQEIINSLRDKIKTIISLYEKEKEENNKLIKEKNDLVESLEVTEERYLQLQKKHELLKLAKSFTGSEGSAHDAKIKINRIVREIDKCISLANK